MMENYQAELNRNIEFIKLADTKAAWVSTVLFAVVGFLVTKSSQIDIFNGKNIWSSTLLPVAVGIVAIYCIYHVARVFLPKTVAKGANKKSLIYHGDISKLKVREFKKLRRKLDEKALEEEYLDQIFITSTIAAKKMYHVRWALLGFVLFAILTAVLLSIIYA